LSVLTLFSVAYTSKELVFPVKECMQWQNNHYERVDCEVKGFATINDIVPTNTNQFSLKELRLIRLLFFLKEKNHLFFIVKLMVYLNILIN